MEKEVFMISVDAEYYKDNYDIFKPPNTEIKSVIVISNDFKNNETHKKLLKKHLKARDELRNYEFDFRHNNKHKDDI